MTERRFPIMRHSKSTSTLQSVPWEFLAQYEGQAHDNHDQSLKRLAERGGLDVAEAWAIVKGLKWRDAEQATELEAEAELRKLIAEWRYPEEERAKYARLLVAARALVDILPDLSPTATIRDVVAALAAAVAEFGDADGV